MAVSSSPDHLEQASASTSKNLQESNQEARDTKTPSRSHYPHSRKSSTSIPKRDLRSNSRHLSASIAILLRGETSWAPSESNPLSCSCHDGVILCEGSGTSSFVSVFGAIYYTLVCPQPPPAATEEQIRVYKEVTEPSVLRQRASIKGKTVREAQKTFRITHADQFVEPGTCYEIDWRSRIIAVAESYVVLY
ncbi:RNA pseudouridine synthase [Vigna angularis]|uniref:RNA pseudouridine synthase n=1 Tax=Phaseolus angularis TaxID=3914 RepID=A0A8T0L5U1_PHAAN|nr:RNA pseudouridine synthase [Vigna angularis]